MGRWGGDTVDIYIGEVKGETALALDQVGAQTPPTGGDEARGTKRKQADFPNPLEEAETFWTEVEDLRRTLRQVAEDVSTQAETRVEDMQALHKSFCSTLAVRLKPLREAVAASPSPAIPAPSVEDIRAEVLGAMETMPRYAQNTKKESGRWHRVSREYGPETPMLLRAPCGWQCGRSTATEVSWTLGPGPRCDKCFKGVDEWIDD
jgi:hypothetical protein